MITILICWVLLRISICVFFIVQLQNELICTQILDKINGNIICINKTILTGQNTIFIDGYTWYGHNRPTKHVNARRGSGGVRLFVKNELFNHFKVEIIDKSTDGILLLQFTHLVSEYTIAVVSCYLPPVSILFFGHLLSISYTLDCHNVVIAGDLNARIVGLHDLIPDVDNISNRVNIDDTKSGHYEEMIDFLLDMKFCVVNGRVTKECDNYRSMITKEYDNYTCVSSSSVVDYMLVPHFTLEQCDSFKVHLVKDLIDPTINTVESLPDHSVLELCIKRGFTSDMITKAILIYVLM